MEDGRRRPDQARLRGGPRPPSAAALRARRPAALRPGQVVSRASSCRDGRSRSIGAATGSRCGAIPDLIDSETEPAKATIADAEKLMGALCTQLGLPPNSGVPGLRGSRLLRARRAEAADQRLARRKQAAGPRRACAHRARVRARPRQAGELRPSGAGVAVARPGPPLGDRALGHAPRQALPDTGRFTCRIPAAHRIARRASRHRLSARSAARSASARRLRCRARPCSFSSARR